MRASTFFQFELWPLDQVLPWQHSDGKPTLHWFGLTDGWYNINAGGIELFRYSEAFLVAQAGHKFRTPYFDYQVARFYEDVLDFFPYVIDPIPDDLLRLVETPSLEHEFAELCYAWSDEHWAPLPRDRPPCAAERADFDRSNAFWQLAAGWWLENHHLSSGHVAGQPSIKVWTHGDTTQVHWLQNDACDPETGVPFSTVTSGSHSMPLAHFVEEVRSFHDRLIAAMTERVQLAQTNWPLKDVEIDPKGLLEEHLERARSFERAMSKASEVRHDWDLVRETIAEMRWKMGKPPLS